ncbi:hypothetical protein [Sphaerotilus microaerophilus]|uniref:Uncharacterized protein n=1 Tax=Sphaerotilus microaerophilus TaxID=2914710 RepID=A0ABN6PLV4_9BURK|nr:hypothetical protein [Sphaerotilus sp. FB-5]BDI04969.1 hypothetical protein CATMQ487_19390 [Sphaerotilus sp. FB-5]
MNPTNLQLELADSEVAAIDLSEGGRWLRLRLRFSAAALRQQAPGEPAVAGHGRNVWLDLTGVEPAAALPAGCFGRIVHGRVRVGGRWLAALPLPGTWAGAPEPIEVELRFGHGSELTLRARGLTCDFEGVPNFRESLAC